METPPDWRTPLLEIFSIDVLLPSPICNVLPCPKTNGLEVFTFTLGVKPEKGTLVAEMMNPVMVAPVLLPTRLPAMVRSPVSSRDMALKLIVLLLMVSQAKPWLCALAALV